MQEFTIRFSIYHCPQLARTYVQNLTPASALLKLDFTNAFNSLRSSLLSPSRLIFRDRVIKLREVIQQGDPLGSALLKEGVQQGDPLGPALQQGDPLGLAFLKGKSQQSDPLGPALFCLIIHSIIMDPVRTLRSLSA